MKKILTLCFFAFALLIGTQTAFAQSNKVNLKEKAYLKVKKISKKFKLNDDSKEQIYNAQYIYEKGLEILNEEHDSESIEYTKGLNTLTQNLQIVIKEELGKDLYKRYLILNDQQEIRNK